MNNLEKYYLDGYLNGSFNKGPVLSKFNHCLQDIHNKILKPGFSLKQKYPFSEDLRPNIYEYDEGFLDILFDNQIPKIIKSCLGYNLCLSHIQLRIAYPFEGDADASYMEWHRDTYFYDNKLVGGAPPVHKLIYYPQLNGIEEEPLKLASGTHLSILKSKKHDYEQIGKASIENIKTDSFIFFNTSLFHSTLPPHKNGTIRIIYNFCLPQQLVNYRENTKLHKKYLERCANG
tara:strand:- start:443 stop:1138 length:696 start_codon:yes stop_codon:yes gene_type:complete